jgi:DNA-binding MarR family transcriptional regulator
MPRRNDRLGAGKGLAATTDDQRDSSYRFLRCSHIFAATVREVLEVKPLRKVSAQPLTVSQFHLLKLMSANGQHQVGDVADFLGVTPPAASKNIDKLQRLGLVNRRPFQGDRRATLLSVSPKGRRLVRSYEALKRRRLGPVLKGFQPEEIDQLTALLERFSVSLLHEEPPGPGACLRCAAYVERDCPVSQIRGGCPYQQDRQATRRNVPVRTAGSAGRQAQRERAHKGSGR